MTLYRDDVVYKELERIINDAGVSVIYGDVPDDSIDGEIWARSDSDSNTIIMPDSEEAFPDNETACLILGHEMGHILSRLDSVDQPIERRRNEAVCDMIGVCLYQLAERTAGRKAEKETFGI